MTQQELGKRVLRLRKKMGISQMELALRCEMPTTSHIASLELGTSNPTFETMRKLVKGLGLPLSELLKDEEPDVIYDSAMNKLIAFASSLTPVERTDLVDIAKVFHRSKKRV